MYIVEAENISKKYVIRSKDRKENLGEKVKQCITSPRKTLAEYKNRKYEEFWALKNVSFKVEQGETIGIVGANGAGKTTLLQVLSRITRPTEGLARIKGEVASLLGVGTGFNDELTGRDNIYLNGSILGINRKGIDDKFNEIIEFSGVEKFLDVPLKRYSSGMKVRLAFSVAAFLQPEVLLIDEVLAVGDHEFRQKCFKRMDDITVKSNRTIFFVSHNLEAVQKLCHRSIYLKKGEVKNIDKTDKIIDEYINENSESLNYQNGDLKYSGIKDQKVQIRRIKILNDKKVSSARLDVNRKFSIQVHYEIKEDIIKNNLVAIHFYNDHGFFFTTMDIDTNENLYEIRSQGKYVSIFHFPENIFNNQKCKLKIVCGIPLKRNFDERKNSYVDIKEDIGMEFINISDFPAKFFSGERKGEFLFKIPCEVKKIDNYANS